MTVKELIEKLSKFPEDLDVEIIATCGYENVGGEIEFVELSDYGNKRVVIY